MTPSSPHREIEIKLRITQVETMRLKLNQHGFRPVGDRLLEADVLFDSPARNLKLHGQALRVRRRGSDSLLTFKGPPAPGRHKDREEIETSVADPRATELILARLGLEPVFRYEKYRTIFGEANGSGVVALDETPIGTFLELEGEAEWIDQTAERLGFSAEDYITSSYASLHFEFCRERGIEHRHMLFSEIGSL